MEQPNTGPRACGVALALLAALLGGCAHVYIGDDGQRHVVGLVHLTLPATVAKAGAETLRTRAIGLVWTRGDAGQALVLGYNDTTLGFVRNDTCVHLGGLGTLAPAAVSTSETSR